MGVCDYYELGGLGGFGSFVRPRGLLGPQHMECLEFLPVTNQAG